MSSHPDADALVRAFLHGLSEETPRLVLADWLDDTGRPQDAAWAAYIRARSAAARRPEGSCERDSALREAADHAAAVTAHLTVDGAHFIHNPHAFLDLLPVERLTVRLAGCVIPPAVLEVIPESVARTCRVVSISEWGRTQFIATPDPSDRDRAQRLEFILNRPVVFVRADAAELDAVIESQYPETESVTEELLTVLECVGIFPPHTPGADPPATQLVNLLLQESIRFGAGWVEITPTPDSALVRFQIDVVWVDRDRFPLRLYPRVVARLADMAGIPPAPDGSIAGEGVVRIAAAGVRASFRVMVVPLPTGPSVWIERVPEAVASA